MAKELEYIYSPEITIENLNKIYYSHFVYGINLVERTASDAYHCEW
ncbi:MAG: hypothetical protein WCQ70_02155 [Lentimicrobiaceae bacterium]